MRNRLKTKIKSSVILGQFIYKVCCIEHPLSNIIISSATSSKVSSTSIACLYIALSSPAFCIRANSSLCLRAPVGGTSALSLTNCMQIVQVWHCWSFDHNFVVIGTIKQETRIVINLEVWMLICRDINACNNKWWYASVNLFLYLQFTHQGA